MADHVRYGVIGTGMMGVEHIRNIMHLDDASVTAVADPHGPSLDEARAAAGADVAAFEDHRQLVASGLCDAVVVASPNMTHRDVLADLLGTGLHLLIEKPLCTTTADCRWVIDAAGDHDAVIRVGLEYRYMPPVRRLIEAVADGAVGTVRMVAIREHRFPFLTKVGHWNRLSENTGGTLVEKCCHFFDLMNLIVGAPPRRVYASGGQDVNHLDEMVDGRPADILDNAFVVVDYDDGARALLDLCMFAEATQDQEQLSVVGDAGKVEALVPSGEFRRGRRGRHWIGGVDTEIVVDDAVRFEGLHHGSSYLEHVAFLDEIRSGSPAGIGLEDGLWSVAVGEAAHRSIEEGRPVDVTELTG